MKVATLPAVCAQVNVARSVHQSTRKVLSPFFQSSVGRDLFPFVCAAKSYVSSPLWGQAYWLENIFDRSNYEIKRSQVDALFLSMFASGLLTMERNRASIRWNIAWTDSETTGYMDDTRWIGMPLHPTTRARVCGGGRELEARHVQVPLKRHQCVDWDARCGASATQ